MQTALTVHSCAKINLSLDIVGLRDDGYHELRSIIHTLDLCDVLRFRFDNSGEWRLRCDDPGLETPDNLCLKATRLWTQHAQQNGLTQAIGGEISLSKRIPYGAGLGGGSGNAWAVLEALSQTFDASNRWISRPNLIELAKTLGADVPLFAQGGAALIEGIGERVAPLSPLQAWVVLAQPRAIISTPASYRAWDDAGLPSGQATASLLQAWNDESAGTAKLQVLAGLLGNDLRHAARALGVPVEDGLRALREAGALGTEMTGSGSAVFGLCRDGEHATQVEAQARELLEAQAAGEWRLWKAALCEYGTRQCS